jgi:hypothetical protein
MSILVTCRRCGTEFAPDRRAIVGGMWRLCADCRDGDAAPASRPLPRPEAAAMMRLSRLRHISAGNLEVVA